jgi:predicted Zn-dependent protease
VNGCSLGRRRFTIQASVFEDSRIAELRRRLREDPASIAFAQLGEDLRRAGRHQEAVDVCRAGLASYPAYLSARVTLGRALIDLNQLDEAQSELETVLNSSPDRFPAARALEILEQRRDPEGKTASLASRRRRPFDDREYVRARRTIIALESWLFAIHVARARRSA